MPKDNLVDMERWNRAVVLPEYLKEINPREMDLIERIIYYSCEAHSNFERATQYLNPVLIEQAEQELSEMLLVVQKVSRMVDDPCKQAILREIQKMLAEDYSHFE